MKRSFISLVFACISVIVLSGFVFFAGWDVSPTNVYLADVPTGETRDVQFTVTAGDSWYHEGGGTVSISGDHPEYFSCVSGCLYYLEPEEEHTVTIRFTAPCSAGNFGATIEFPTYSNNSILSWIGASVTGSSC